MPQKRPRHGEPGCRCRSLDAGHPRIDRPATSRPAMTRKAAAGVSNRIVRIPAQERAREHALPQAAARCGEGLGSQGRRPLSALHSPSARSGGQAIPGVAIEPTGQSVSQGTVAVSQGAVGAPSDDRSSEQGSNHDELGLLPPRTRLLRSARKDSDWFVIARSGATKQSRWASR